MAPSVLITGCSEGGIGFALARAYHDEGYMVFATARRPAAMKTLSELGITTLQLDVTDTTSIKAVSEIVQRTTGGILDILVNNAGQAAPGAAVEIDIEAAKQAFDTNFFGVMRMCQEFVDPLIRAQGKILNVGSIVGVLPLPFSAAYNASKAALHQYSDTLRIELQPYGVSVSTVLTGTIATNIWHGDPDLTADSKYYIINDQYVAHRQNEAGAKNAMDVDVYARWLVTQTANKPGEILPVRIWKGLYTTRVWLFDAFLPRWLLLRITTKLYGLHHLAPRLKASGWTPSNPDSANKKKD